MDHPLSPDDARRLILEILDNGTVEYWKHAELEMAKDRLTKANVENALWFGTVVKSDLRKGSWRYQVERGRTGVVVQFLSETALAVVTAWRN